MAKQIPGSVRGAALIIALLILLVLTLMGLSLINTATFEAFVTGNERVRMEAFYAAEAGLQTAIANLPKTDKVKHEGKASYWTGTPQDRESPREADPMGHTFYAGGEIGDFAYKRYKIRVTGESSGSMRELEAQVKWYQMVRTSPEY